MLSAEIIVIALGTVAAQPFASQLAVLTGIGLVMTVGVYGFVAAIVKLDDAGMLLLEREAAVLKAVGRLLLATAPRLMKLLTVVGTAAMFLVGEANEVGVITVVEDLESLFRAHYARLVRALAVVSGSQETARPWRAAGAVPRRWLPWCWTPCANGISGSSATRMRWAPW